METKNATIGSADLTDSDHGILSSTIFLNYGSGITQGFGGYNLYSPHSRGYGVNGAGYFIWRIMEVVGVSSWSQLEGKNVRVRIEDTGMVSAIGHITEDKWFNPGEELKELQAQVALGTAGMPQDTTEDQSG